MRFGEGAFLFHRGHRRRHGATSLFFSTRYATTVSGNPKTSDTYNASVNLCTGSDIPRSTSSLAWNLEISGNTVEIADSACDNPSTALLTTFSFAPFLSFPNKSIHTLRPTPLSV